MVGSDECSVRARNLTYRDAAAACVSSGTETTDLPSAPSCQQPSPSLSHMSLVERSRFGLSRVVAWIPVDLVGVIGFVALAGFVVLRTSLGGTPRALLALGLVLFVPGYALVAALFPRNTPRKGAGFDWRRSPPVTEGRLDLPARLALSFGTSVALAPLAGIGIVATGRPLTAETAAGSLGGFAVMAMGIATVRRWRLPPEERYRVPVGRTVRRVRAAIRTRSRRRVALDLTLAASVVLASAGLAYAVTTPHEPTPDTEVALLTEDDDGEYVAADLPPALVHGEPTDLTLGIENHEGEQVEYSTVVVLERIDGDGDIEESEEVIRFDAEVEDGITAYVDHQIVPEMVGEEFRLSYYVYAGSAPDEVSPATADRHLYVWVDVIDD